jgi:predicted anti-sigma-YlaC factor YlaD
MLNTQAIRPNGIAGLLVAGVLAAALSGCAIKPFIVNKVGNALANGGDVYASDSDVELVGAASPFGLKLLESLLAESPKHPGLLLALTRGFTQYAYAFVDAPADVLEEHDVTGAYAARERARKLYLRARDYGLRGLDVAHPGVAAQLRRDPDGALAQMRRADVPLLYWTAVAWGEAISLGKDDPYLVADLPSVQHLAARALALDESFNAGSVHSLFISLAMSEAGPEPQRVAAARQHFERAVELSHGHQAAPFVTYAESVAVPTGNRAAFDDMLERALSVDTEAEPNQRLANELFLRRARWLRGRADELFTQ